MPLMLNNPKPINIKSDEVMFRLYISVDGGLSDWTTWGVCSQSCGDTAIQSRDRTCTKPPPSGGDKNCSGETFEIKFCEQKPCHKGKYLVWTFTGLCLSPL